MSDVAADERRVGEPTLARGRLFLTRYHELRREVLTGARDDDPTPLCAQVHAAAAPDFAAWVAVVGPRYEFSLCRAEHEHAVERCGELFSAGLDLRGALEDVDHTGESVAWSEGGAACGVIIRLVVDDQPAGVVVVARAPEAPAWDDDDIGAIHDVVTALGIDLERLELRYHSRVAVRASQRVASQLHQVISASLIVGSLTTEAALAQSLVKSARSIFDAERAVVVLGDGPDETVAVAVRGRGRRVGPVDEGDRPAARPGATEAWVDGRWLCAPVLDGQRRTRGVVAARRSTGDFREEDRELAQLLGQLAATSLDSFDLNRTIHDNEIRLRILVDAAPIGIVESDIDGRLRWWNRAASRLLRWPDAPDGSASTDAPPWPSDVGVALDELWRDLLTGGVHGTREFTASVAGRERLLAASAAVVPTGASQPAILTLIDDVTDQRELREEMRHAHRMELRGQVASTVAHDFNNLITLILGYAELLTRAVAGNSDAQELVRDIQSTSTRASALTAQLQSIGRTSEPAPVRLDVASALSANAEVLERIMGSRITVTWSLADATPPVTIDADLFEQMILNLSLNARDAMPEGGTLHFATSTDVVVADDDRVTGAVPGTYVVLTITDTGTGMDEATRARCFEPLFTTKGPFKGTGLGLASARRLVESSGGVITCASQLGIGTTFTIWLPALLDGPGASPANDESRPALTTARARLTGRILLCEDDAGLRRMARRVLERNGFEVLEAVSAEDALEIDERTSLPFDLLVSDVVLPEMAGTELAAELQRRHHDLPVVMMSGTASAEVLDGLVPESATFVAKPFKPSVLVDEVIALLSRRASQRV